MAVWNHIDHTSLSLPAATVTWTSISGSYDHLLLLLSARSDQSTYVSGMSMKFNSATSTYSETRMFASNTASITSNRKHGESILRAWGDAAGASVLADTFSSNTVWIPNYSNTTSFKQFVSQSAVANNSTASGQSSRMESAGLWSSASAITRIDIGIVNGDDFVANSTFDLYGILGA